MHSFTRADGEGWTRNGNEELAIRYISSFFLRIP